MTEIPATILTRIQEAWPGTTLDGDIVPLAGGFWASMYRIRVCGQPLGVPSALVVRLAPDAAMGAKELAVQRAVAETGFPTPRVRLDGVTTDGARRVWSVTDFAPGVSPLADLDGLRALRRAPRLLARLADQLARPMARLHTIGPAPVTAAVRAAAPTVAWSVDDVVAHLERDAHTVGRRDVAAALRVLVARRPRDRGSVICHGDLHPFNLLIDDQDRVTVIDWTAALCAEPAFDVAFTALLLANPPLAAPGPLALVIRRVGRALAGRFIASYRRLAPGHDLRMLDWYRALHGARVLIDSTTLDARDERDRAHPFHALTAAAASSLESVTGTVVGVDSRRDAHSDERPEHA